MKQERRKNEKGFTMVELIIVLAIMAILGAVLVPSFSRMTKKAQITADITTVKSLQRIVDVYYVDKENTYPTAINTSTGEVKKEDLQKELGGKDATTDKGIYMKEGETINIKSGNELEWDTSRNHLCVKLKPEYQGIFKAGDANVDDGWIK